MSHSNDKSVKNCNNQCGKGHHIYFTTSDAVVRVGPVLAGFLRTLCYEFLSFFVSLNVSSYYAVFFICRTDTRVKYCFILCFTYRFTCRFTIVLTIYMFEHMVYIVDTELYGSLASL